MNNFTQLNLQDIPIYYNSILSEYLNNADLVKTEEIFDYGFNNYLFKLTVTKGNKRINYYLKQARGYNKRSYLKGKPIYVSSTRISGEVDLLKRLNKIWPNGTVPKIIYYDKKNCVFLMNDISLNSKFLAKEFSSNKVHPEIGKAMGNLLAKLHTTTWKKNIKPKSDISYQNDLKKILFEQYWSKGIKKIVNPKIVNDLLKVNKLISTSIIWGDPVHRNIFVKSKGKVSLIDFDHTLKYNPLIDSGILLSHWIWMWLKPNKKLKNDCEKFIKNYCHSYFKVWRKHPKFNQKIQDNMDYWLPKWIGWYILSRTEGQSGSYFTKWPKWEKDIRSLGIDLISENNSKNSKQVLELLK